MIKKLAEKLALYLIKRYYIMVPPEYRMMTIEDSNIEFVKVAGEVMFTEHFLGSIINRDEHVKMMLLRQMEPYLMPILDVQEEIVFPETPKYAAPYIRFRGMLRVGEKLKY